MILIGGSGPTDRDETVAGIPVFGQVARDLVAAGFIVVRYDKRGVGQSGGRAESATIADYAEDARQVRARGSRKRKGVDKDRIAPRRPQRGRAGRHADRRPRARQGRGDGAHCRRRQRAASEVVLEQQKHMLSKMPIDEAQRQEKIALQEKINTAVIKGTGWADIPLAARRVADTPWFYSFLTFDPEKAMNDTRQPVVIVQGELDTQVHAASRRQARGDRARAQGTRRRRSREGARRQSPARAREDRRRYRILVARSGREGLAAGDVGDYELPDESPEGLSARSAQNPHRTRSGCQAALNACRALSPLANRTSSSPSIEPLRSTSPKAI